jgi:hypothetical protein
MIHATDPNVPSSQKKEKKTRRIVVVEEAKKKKESKGIKMQAMIPESVSGFQWSIRYIPGTNIVPRTRSMSV